MWIKTCTGEWLNSDHIKSIGTMGTDTVAAVVDTNHAVYISRTKDIRREIIEAIVSNATTMEVDE